MVACLKESKDLTRNRRITDPKPPQAAGRFKGLAGAFIRGYGVVYQEEDYERYLNRRYLATNKTSEVMNFSNNCV
jgi:hypothetical protein